jgi:hypothetical protein
LLITETNFPRVRWSCFLPSITGLFLVLLIHLHLPLKFQEEEQEVAVIFSSIKGENGS